MDFKGFKIDPGEVTILTFNRPRVNIFSTEVLKDFIKALKTLKKAKELKVLLLTGDGNTFMAGADIKEMSGFSAAGAKRFARLFHEALSLLEDFPRPVVAAVNGFALGGGVELILVCDMVIAADCAVFGSPEINLGIIPGAGGTQRLKQRIGGLRAKELIFTGKRISAEEAFSMGLINRVVPVEGLMEEAKTLAKTISSKPLQCLEAAKRLIDSGTLEKEINVFSRIFSFEDRKRLMEEFLKKG